MTEQRFDTQDLKNAQLQGIDREGVTSKPGYSSTSEYSSDMAYDNKSVEGPEGILRNENVQNFDERQGNKDSWQQDNDTRLIETDR